MRFIPTAVNTTVGFFIFSDNFLIHQPEISDNKSDQALRHRQSPDGADGSCRIGRMICLLHPDHNSWWSNCNRPAMPFPCG